VQQNERDSLKELTATLIPELLPPQKLIEGSETIQKKERKVNPDVLTFFATDRFGWRSARYDLIESYTIAPIDDYKSIIEGNE
jgi:hypothetical protein